LPCLFASARVSRNQKYQPRKARCFAVNINEIQGLGETPVAKAARTALITGSGRNIGRGCAKELARLGFNIVVNGSSDRAACKRVADAVRAIGTNALVAMADVGDQAAVENMAHDALDAFGRIDVLINNAAIRPAASFLEMSDADLARVMNVNCYAAVWLTRAFLPGMVEAGWGRIINVSGMNAQQGTGGRPGVTMSKHAAWGLTKALSREFGPAGITANIISPGTFPDEGTEIASSPRFAALLADNPAGRLGTPEDIASLVGLLCSDQGGFINGQLLQVNGGVVG
jgi:3-oxoacyl-[acyl-carrier protein] reductase